MTDRLGRRQHMRHVPPEDRSFREGRTEEAGKHESQGSCQAVEAVR
jgi:hypothetical protein